jgi:ASPM-SPD-2-Hydin domain-containing protein
MLYLGVDLHKRSCWVTVLDREGHEREQRKLSTEPATLREYFGKLPKPANAGASDAFVSKISSPFSLSLSPASLKFGSRVLNTTSASQSITLLNTGVMPQFWSPRRGRPRACPVQGTHEGRPYGETKTEALRAPQTVTMTNVTNAAVNISRIVSTNGDFTQTNNCSAVVAAKSSCSLKITFTPHLLGRSAGSINIFDDGGGSPQGVIVYGTGTL